MSFRRSVQVIHYERIAFCSHAVNNIPITFFRASESASSRRRSKLWVMTRRETPMFMEISVVRNSLFESPERYESVTCYKLIYQTRLTQSCLPATHAKFQSGRCCSRQFMAINFLISFLREDHSSLFAEYPLYCESSDIRSNHRE